VRGVVDHLRSIYSVPNSGYAFPGTGLSALSQVVPADLGADYDHVAVAAPRIRDLLPLYADMLGGDFYTGGDNPRVGYRAVQLQLRNGGRVELMEPLSGHVFLDRFFQRTGGGGLHHITFKVPDIKAALAAAQRQGFTPTGVFLGNARWQELFLHPKETAGVLIQLVEAPDFSPAQTSLDQVLAGNGPNGTGVASP
jgi:methylmalonyl-CoA/ethylmalonyl-CoA epimerase